MKEDPQLEALNQAIVVDSEDEDQEDSIEEEEKFCKDLD